MRAVTFSSFLRGSLTESLLEAEYSSICCRLFSVLDEAEGDCGRFSLPLVYHTPRGEGYIHQDGIKWGIREEFNGDREACGRIEVQ